MAVPYGNSIVNVPGWGWYSFTGEGFTCCASSAATVYRCQVGKLAPPRCNPV
ncbi:MAG: hypothetical protein H6560_14625 [Lewinellaceae bacterium]|nr:hypothetical protein [Lewinellaceae bacterium]